MQKKCQEVKLLIKVKSWIIKIKVLFIVILPIVVISYSVFSGTPNAKEKLDLFFEYFNNLPDWYVWLTVGIFGSIYGLKPGLDIFKKK
jgi:hypothetical protein